MNTCQICKKQFDDSETYEYRGFLFCEEHFDEGIAKVDGKREMVMETIEKSVKSQRSGEFVNNRTKYNLGNVAEDGLPIMKVKEPMIEEEYRQGKL